MRSGDVDQPRLRRVVDLLIPESGVRFEWFQVFGTRFFDESDLSHVGLGQSRRFSAWRQRTGSALCDPTALCDLLMAVTGRSNIVKSKNAVPPWSSCSFAATPARGQLTPNSLERVYTGPGLESRCRPSPWLMGRNRGP